ncbi:MAG: DNA-binding protein [Lachnospiraceae bacterium]|nr:DNA-binding protein [Lachnospiraceae bacterium]
MDRIVEKGWLYDYYGALLTDRQRQIYEDAVYNDLSLSELADTYGISRQGVHDLLKRCDKSLQEYEDKLGCIKRDKALEHILQTMTEQAEQKKDEQMAQNIRTALDILKTSS